MPTRRGLLQALACLPFTARVALAAGGSLAERGAFAFEERRAIRGFACALGEDADAAGLPAARREGEFLALALAGTARPDPEKLRELTGSAQAAWLELSPNDRAGADDGPLAERIRTAASVTLIEGELFDWLVALWPARKSSAVLGALAECALSGGRTIGRGATALLVAAGGVVRGATREERGESRVRLENPRESGEPRLARGLQLVPKCIVDTRARSNGSLLRLLSTLIENHEDRGVLLGARSALCCDLETRDLVALGEEPMIVIDVSGSRRRVESVEGAHVSVLAAGDGWRASERTWFGTGEPRELGPAEEPTLADGLALERLLAPPLAARVSRDERTRVELRGDAGTRVFAGPASAPLRAHRLRLDAALARGRWGELGL